MWIKDQCEKADTIAIIGMSKNAGKTTVMNTLLKGYIGDKIAITSIGLDGEAQDTLSFKAKPRIIVYQGMLVATTSQALNESSATIDIIQTLDITTPLGDIVIGQVKKEGRVLLAGPSTLKGLQTIKKALFQKGASKLFIDGALFRKSFAKQSLVDGVILVSGAIYHKDIDKLVKDTATVARQLMRPKETIDPLAKNLKAATKTHDGHIVMSSKQPLSLNPLDLERFIQVPFDFLQIRGALTNQVVTKLLEHRTYFKDKTLVIDHATDILCDVEQYRYLEQIGLNIVFRHHVDVLFVAINPFSPSGYVFDDALLHQKMKDHCQCPVINVQTDVELIR